MAKWEAKEGDILQIHLENGKLTMEGKEGCIVCPNFSTCDHEWDIKNECWVPCG